MRKKIIIFILALSILTVAAFIMKYVKSDEFVKNAFEKAEKQLSYTSRKTADSTKIPRSINNDGSLHTVNPSDWTSGFFPGSLWYVYEFTKNEAWKKDAERWT